MYLVDFCMSEILVEKAYEALFPDYELDRQVIVRYSGRFKGYTGNVKYTTNYLEFHLSSLWKEIGDEITIGLIQVLLLKVFSRRKKVKTINMELYEIFLRKVASVVPTTKQDPVLLASFERVNYHFFNGIMEPCNLVWGKKSTRKFGSYDFSNDSITISSIFKGLLPEKEYLMDYVMYHEMLHKKLKFNSSEGMRRSYHTKEFKELERKYPNHSHCESELGKIAISGQAKRFIRRVFPF